MIIFDLDGTLADCEHRRHFVEAPWDNCHNCYQMLNDYKPDDPWIDCPKCSRNPFKWNIDWKSFYRSCVTDTPIEPVVSILYDIMASDRCPDIEIWSGRCESVRAQTEEWLSQFMPPVIHGGIDEYKYLKELKMRPIGDSTPDDQLKERWLDEAIAAGKQVEYVFDDRPKVVRMWRRRGIFVFNVNQSDKEF